MSEVITFYSYKGGVGRTMALANVSVVLAKWGHKVLVVDWDLEAPGLEHFYKDYIEDIKQVETTPGVIDLLQLDENNKWQDDIIQINIPQFDVPIHLISSGKRDEDYFRKVRSFDVDDFYEKDGGDIIERLRNEWLASYDYVLIDSRTGITEIGGICTIQLPDTVVMLFTATNQGFDGVLDIIKRAGAAQQKLPYDRQKLIFLPIPSKFDSNPEFKLSQEWLERFARELERTYNDWLPASIDRKDFLELTKIPYIPYFSFGEKLPVLEQGVRDPSGLGYAYESLAVLIADHLTNVNWLYSKRDQYIASVNRNPSLETDTKRNGNGNSIEKRLRLLRQSLNMPEDEVTFKKSKEIILDCLERSIVPLLETVSLQIKKFDTFFKSKNEKFNILGYNIGASGPFFDETKSTLSKLSTDVFLDYNKKGYELNSVEYSINFKNLRKSKIGNIELPFRLTIEFHETVFEIKSDDGVVNIDKLYHEVITTEECESIAQTLGTSLLEKIEDNFPNVTSIKYISWHNDKWEARFEKLQFYWENEILFVSNPQFEHTSNETHKTHVDGIINYLSTKGEEWSARCIAHVSSDNTVVSFTFEHTSRITNKTHSSPNIRFLDWNMVLWDATVATRKVNSNGDKPMVFVRQLG